MIIKIKKIFSFLSSVKLAVPVMLALLIASVAGTLYESKYNAEYAGFVIYKKWWFFVILGLLFINILFAALSRYPWKKRHTGFLITHLGMLLLLVGSVITMVWGIDGTMQIYEKSDSSVVFLQNNVLEVGQIKYPITRGIEERNLSFDKELENNFFKLETFLPFVEFPEKTYNTGTNLNFKIKSAFFDVVQVLNTEMEPEISMGPAVFKLVQNDLPPIQDQKIDKKIKKIEGKNQLLIKNSRGEIIQSIKLDKSKELNLNGVVFKVTKTFKNAQIINNKIEEGGTEPINPAVELQVSKNGQILREIVYQNIPEFSLNPEGVFGYSFILKLTEFQETHDQTTKEMPSNHPPIPGQSARIKNTVEFKILEDTNVEISLFKNVEKLQSQILKNGEMITTPWMGIELTYLGVQNASEPFVPRIAELKRKMPLPPSAIKLKTKDQESWIVENSEISLQMNNTPTTVYYGRERLYLPFALALEKFEKNDYPGSEMAKDYKSYVKVNGQGLTHEIYMNEPFKLEGFTFYQSSYQLSPGAPALTILSVNRDPGRALKYIGSLILCLGIIIYTLQKSKRTQKILNL